ncbi:TRAP transporter substrate-binding protein DctP [Guyparkeria hydrothermalis]|uniref:TRAP transporter substrate-binding protein DctP n=1 Tax=Guyparkeria hydrothermalis TaxID=923 RepID=UPI002020F317|nr:TRAP transporter substrate-binding protein DctP [Guyparkeria hydrothermalis]MCL7744731.1 TRAP transporter substrate-binding protein DctP [Guyparkeria hydrothermalis]
MESKRFLHKGALWMGAVAMAAGLTLTGCGQNGDDEQAKSGESEQVWRFALEETKGGVQWKYAEKFKELIESEHENVDVKIYPYGTLGSSQDITQQIQNNTMQFAFASAGHVGSTIPEAQVFTLHFLFSQDDSVNEEIFASNPVVYEELGAAYNEKGLELLSIIPEGWMVWSANKAITQPSDFEGVKIRVKPSDLLLATYEGYGANPKPMAYSEIYGGLQRGQIDAQTQPMFAIRDMSFYEVQDYLIEARNAQFVSTVITSPGFLEGLPEDMRASVKDAIKELDPYIWDVQKELNANATEEIKSKSDIEFIELTADQVEAFRASVEPVFDQYVEMAGPRGEKILNAIQEAVAEGGSE